MDSEIPLKVMGSIFTLGSVAAMVLAVKQARDHAIRVKTWRTVAGVVVHSAIQKQNVRRQNESFTYFDLDVRYEYQLAGVTHRGRGGDTLYSQRAAAESEQAKYPVGGPVTVHYDPAKPELSRLKLEDFSSPGSIILGAAAALLVGLGMLILS